MRRMTVGMVTMARRKTRFPTDIGSRPTEAKPTASVTAFCVYLIPLQHQRMEDDNQGDTSNRPTPPYYIYRAHLSAHPGYEKAPDRVGAVPTTSSCFFTGDSRTFFTATGRFLNRGGCCRHAAHDGGECWDAPSGNIYIHAHEQHTLHDKTHVSSGNSVGVAIPQPRVAREARYPG